MGPGPLVEVASRGSPDIVVRDLVRRAPGGRLVLDRLTATFAAGEVSGVHGANGSGKSMLARVLAGVDRADAGSVSTVRSAVFLLPERAAVLPGCSARTLGAALASSVSTRGVAWSVRLDDALERLRSTHGSRTSMSRLSKGNLQKAYLAVAYALHPAVVVLDEPLTGLDALATVAASAMVRELAADGSVVVVTAHQPVGFADSNRLLARGRLELTTLVTATGYVVDLAPTDQARLLLAESRLGLGLVDEPESTGADRIRVRVDADRLDLLLRTALEQRLKITRVVEVDTC